MKTLYALVACSIFLFSWASPAQANVEPSSSQGFETLVATLGTLSPEQSLALLEVIEASQQTPCNLAEPDQCVGSIQQLPCRSQFADFLAQPEGINGKPLVECLLTTVPVHANLCIRFDVESSITSLNVTRLIARGQVVGMSFGVRAGTAPDSSNLGKVGIGSFHVSMSLSDAPCPI